MTSGNWTYDVALSFAGEDRECALDLATRLHACGYRVFFDRFEELWGQDLGVKLQEVYAHQSRYCVVFVSKHYLSKPWTNHERRILIARAMKQTELCLLPVRLDDSELPGLSDVIAYKDLRLEPIEAIFESLRRLLGPVALPESGAWTHDLPSAGLELYPSDFLYGVVHLDSPDRARFNIGYHLINGGTDLRSLHRLEATITPQEQLGIQFIWHAFVDIGEDSMQRSPHVLPLALAGGESRLLGAQFVGPRIGRGLLWRSGDHDVEIVGWTDAHTRRRHPDVRARFSVTVSEIECRLFDKCFDAAAHAPAGAVAVPMSIVPGARG